MTTNRSCPLSLSIDDSSLKLFANDIDFVRRAIELPMDEPFESQHLHTFVLVPFNVLAIALNYVQLSMEHDEFVHGEQMLHHIARICIRYGDFIRCSTRLEHARHVFFNYHLRIAMVLTRGIEQILSNNSQQISSNRLVHLTGMLMYSTREVFHELSYVDRTLDELPAPLSIDNLQQVLSPSQRYSYFKHNRTLNLFMRILQQLASSNKSSSTIIPDAPPLPSEFLTTTETINDDTYDLDNLFSEKNTTVSTNSSSTSKSTHNRSMSSQCRQRPVLNRYLDIDMNIVDEFTEQDDYNDLMTYLDKTYLSRTRSILIDDLKSTLNTDEQIVRLTYFIQHSNGVPRFIYNLLEQNILTDDNEDRLMTKLGLPLDQSWPINISLQSLIILLKIVLKRNNAELITCLWHRFLQSLTNPSNDITLELIEVFLLMFHQLSVTQRKSIIIELLDFIQIHEKNFYYLVLFEYFIYHFYEIPSKIIEHIQSMITCREYSMTTYFPQIIARTSTDHLDSFAMKTICQCSTYHQFYVHLIEQLDFTKHNKGKYTR
jgi:hypothetical protein